MTKELELFKLLAEVLRATGEAFDHRDTFDAEMDKLIQAYKKVSPLVFDVTGIATNPDTPELDVEWEVGPDGILAPDADEEQAENEDAQQSIAKTLGTISNRFFELPNAVVEFPEDGATVMVEVESSNLSLLGFGPLIQREDHTEQTAFIMFKGQAYYKYEHVHSKQVEVLMEQALGAEAGEPEASLGSMFHHLVKVPADEGTIKCFRLKDERWVEVPKKSDRIKEAKGR